MLAEFFAVAPGTKSRGHSAQRIAEPTRKTCMGATAVSELPDTQLARLSAQRWSRKCPVRRASWMLLLAARVASLRAGDQANPPGMQMDREDASESCEQAEESDRGDTGAYARMRKSDLSLKLRLSETAAEVSSPKSISSACQKACAPILLRGRASERQTGLFRRWRYGRSPPIQGAADHIFSEQDAPT